MAGAIRNAPLLGVITTARIAQDGALQTANQVGSTTTSASEIVSAKNATGMEEIATPYTHVSGVVRAIAVIVAEGEVVFPPPSHDEFDYGKCECDDRLLHNGKCDASCSTAFCNWDGGDCRRKLSEIRVAKKNR